VLVICAARHDLLERWVDRPAGPDVLEIALEPLSPEATGAIVDNLLGEAGADAELRSRLAHAAEGYPLFAEQLLSMLIEEGRLNRVGDAWQAGDLSELTAPPTIHALMAARLDNLDQDERRVVEAASVAGLTFAQAAVEELVPEEVRDRAGDHLVSLTRKQFVRPEAVDALDGPTFRFRHVAIRDAAYGSLLKRTRSALHERFAEWADRAVGDRAIEFEEILAWHLEQAYRSLAELGPLDLHGIELGVHASQRLCSAARRAFGRGDMPAASGLFRRSAALLPELAPARLELLPDFGEALMDLGEFAEAGAVLDEAVEGAVVLGDARLLAEAKLVRLLVVRHGAESAGWGEQVLREAERAMPVFEAAASHAELARTHRLLAYVYATACRYGEAAAAAEQAIEHARLAADTRQEARAVTMYAMSALYGPTPVEDAIRRCEELAEADLGDRQAEGLVLCALSQLHAMRGDFETGRELYGQARALLEDVGGKVAAASTSLDSAGVEMLAGEPAVAEAELRRDYELLERMGEKYVLPTIAALLAQAVYAQGRYGEAVMLSTAVEELGAGDDVDAQALWRCVRAKALAREGQFDEAEDLARAGVELLRATDSLVPQADALADLAEVLRLAGRSDEAEAALDEATSLYVRKGNTAAAARARCA
jgi:tetratricopeptide (TPR) repeat protein